MAWPAGRVIPRLAQLLGWAARRAGRWAWMGTLLAGRREREAGLLQADAVPGDSALHVLGQVLPEVPAVCALDRVGCTVSGGKLLFKGEKGCAAAVVRLPSRGAVAGGVEGGRSA